MKIIYIHQYFVTPDQPGGTRSYWISKELVKRGHQVVMITTSINKSVEAGRRIVDGIDVIYIKNEYDNSMSKIKKLWSFTSYVREAIKIASKEKNVDLVFATSTPLTVGLVSLWLKKIKKWPYVFEVRDLWPEFPIQIGVIRNNIVIKILRKFEHQIYKKSNHIIALSPGMREGILLTGEPEGKVSMIPNMSKPDEFFPREKNLEFAKIQGIDLNKFNILHFGSMGIANGLEYIIDTATELQKRGVNDVDFIFSGWGATREILVREIQKRSLTNVKMLGNFSMKEMSELVNLCNLSITCFKDLPILYTNSPNKLFDSLSAGIPIVVNSAGWTKDLVETEDCGFYVDPHHPEEFASKILEIKNQTKLLNKWSKNARRLAIDVYNKEKLSAQVADVLENAIANQ